MDERQRRYVRQWLCKAWTDLKAARRRATSPDALLDAAFFHCRQAAEKAAKGYLAYRGHPLEKTHDVEKLVETAKSYEPRLAAWQQAAADLTPYATAFRYPSDTVDPDEKEFQQAEQAAAGLLAFVCSLLPEDVQPPDMKQDRPDGDTGSKQGTIYVLLPDEAVDVWRPVLAERLGASIFRIAEQEYNRSDERWEFGPGEVVCCKPMQLSEGIFLVAKRRA